MSRSGHGHVLLIVLIPMVRSGHCHIKIVIDEVYWTIHYKVDLGVSVSEIKLESNGPFSVTPSLSDRDTEKCN